MHRNPSLIEQFDRDRDSDSKQKGAPWSILVLLLGSVLTCAWIGFLFWAVFHFREWAFG